MNRRDFLLLRPGGAKRPAVLSCEQLYMRFVDARSDGRTDGAPDGATEALFDALARDLDAVRVVRLTETSWMSCEELRRPLERVLEGFRAGGGRVLKGSRC
jgi:hypothetical protein